MSRTEQGYLIMLMLIAVVLAVTLLTMRYLRYRRALIRGKPGPPVWKPFWID
ncbi:MAG: hypothetical protein ABIP41_05865 [Croceibacterium sp.]